MQKRRNWLLGIVLMTLAGCGTALGPVPESSVPESRAEDVVTQEALQPEPTIISTEAARLPYSFIDAEGDTLETRFRTPEGYERAAAEPDSFAAYVREYPMKADGSPVLLYNGLAKPFGDPAAVFALPLEAEDLQQCADSVMRIYGEYFYQRGEYDRIRYSLGGGFTADFGKWSRGYGIRVDGNDVSWVTSESHDESYGSFQKFMRMVFAYSGTLNLEDDSRPVEVAELRIGDIFIKGGSPGHVVMVADVCLDSEGRKAFLLAQGYMPAQEFHVVKNPAHEEDPWYYEEELEYPFRTAEYTFPEECLRRPPYLEG